MRKRKTAKTKNRFFSPSEQMESKLPRFLCHALTLPRRVAAGHSARNTNWANLREKEEADELANWRQITLTRAALL